MSGAPKTPMMSVIFHMFVGFQNETMAITATRAGKARIT